MQTGPDVQSKPSEKPSLFKAVMSGIVSGGAAGAAEVTIDHPLWSLKTRYQNESIPPQQKFTLNPRTLYRGFIPNVVSMVPITALQITAAEWLNAYRHTEDNPPSESEALSYAAAGGALSAVVSSPTELAMAQQTERRGFFSTLRHIFETQGIRGLMRGMAGTAMRDAKFTMGYGYVGPKLKEEFSNYMPETQASIAGGVTAGLAVAGLSQPWDTLKTAQQTGFGSSMWELAKEKAKKEGIRGFYKGSMWRMGRVGSAIMIMGEVTQRVGEWMNPKI